MTVCRFGAQKIAPELGCAAYIVLPRGQEHEDQGAVLTPVEPLQIRKYGVDNLLDPFADFLAAAPADRGAVRRPQPLQQLDRTEMLQGRCVAIQPQAVPRRRRHGHVLDDERATAYVERRLAVAQ